MALEKASKQNEESLLEKGEKVSVVGDSPMTRIMDLPKENINQELNW